MNAPFYPLRFAPIYDSPPSGGRLLTRYLTPARPGDALAAGTGCSWELVDTPERQSRITNGSLTGLTFGEAVRAFPAQIVGARHPAAKPFPIYIRLLDAGRAHPLAVHPSAPVEVGELSAQPNTKFWFALDREDGAEIVAGVRPQGTRMQLLQNVNRPTLTQYLQIFPSQSGDAFFIPDGRIHGLGAGNLVLEVGERPTVPLRLALRDNQDAALPDSEREQACAAINFQDRQLGRISRESRRTTQTRKIPLLHFSPRFVIDEVRLCDHLFDATDGDSFHLVCVVAGTVEIQSNAGTERLQSGSLACIPAQLGDYRIYVRGDIAVLLRVMLQKTL